MQKWFNIKKFINIIYDMKQLKEKTHSIMLIETENVFKNSAAFFFFLM